MGFFITEPNTGDYLIQLKTERSRTTDQVISDIRARVEASQPALRIDFGQVITDMLGDLMSSVQPVEVKIFGDNQEQLHHLSSQVADIVSSVKGTADVFNGIVIAGPSLTITPDFSKLAQFGLTPAGFQYQIQTYLEGNTVGAMLEKEQLTPIRMVYPNSRSRNVNDISGWQFFLPNGKLNPITSLATVTINPGDAEIQRQDLQSMGVVTARLENIDLGTVMKNIQSGVNAKINLPQGYHIAYGGSFAEQQQSFQELLFILITASLLVFGVILFLFREFKLAFIILAISVLGISGSWLALFITGTPLNVGSYTGLIMIVGIIGENAIFTILQFKEARMSKSVDESVIYSISTRLRPKLMTAFGAIIALTPLALGIGAGAQLHQPLAIAVIGGFVVAIPLLLIVLPSMLRWVYGRQRIQSTTV
jgi:Cu/Ag efflux pump CusA